MDELQNISNSLFTNNMLGLLVALAIFIVTVLLVIRKVIGFVLTIIFLFFAVISGLAIAHNDIVRDYLQKRTESTPRTPVEAAPTPNKTTENESWGDKLNHVKDQFLEQIDSIKKEYFDKKSSSDDKKS